MTMSITCDECNNEIGHNGNHFCDNCFDEQKDAVKTLEDRVGDLEGEVKELEEKLDDAEREKGE